MTRPRLLDLFSGAGGAAVGYHRAGFDVVGVDIAPQPHYPFEFHQADAMTFPLAGFDVVHASPPCQAYSIANNIHGRTDHLDLIDATRNRLVEIVVPWVIENVVGSPLRNYVQLCGLSFALNVRRHRWFESNVPLWGMPCSGHDRDYLMVFGGGARGRAHVTGRAKGGGPVLHRSTHPLAASKAAMGIDWMTRDELSQAIPPAYTTFIGEQLMVALGHAERARTSAVEVQGQGL